MPQALSSARDPDPAHYVTWPWSCLACGATVFTDVEYCPDCDSDHRHGSDTGPDSTRWEFVKWMRHETYPTYILKISVISSAELVLTALWLQLVLLGPTELLRGALVFA